MKFLERLWMVGLFLVTFLTNTGARAQPLDNQQANLSRTRPYSFTEAVQYGVVELFANPWAALDPNELIERLPEINPGLVNRVGFQFGGFTMKKYEYAAKLASSIHAILPRARVGGGFPESLKADYAEEIPCEGEQGMQRFRTAEIGSQKGGNYIWVDMALPRAQQFYICIGELLIKAGFDHLHFEECDHIIEHSSSPEEAVKGFLTVRKELIAFGKRRGLSVSFSGEPKLSQVMPLEAVYLPCRFYINSFATQYRNKIGQPGKGVGYTYALSPKLIRDSLKAVPQRTRLFFYVDNFDYKQDDLRRMMELDGDNRRTLIIESAKNARAQGVSFLPNLNHCDGCIPVNLVGDQKEIVSLPSGKSVSEYNALHCGDLSTVKRALQIQGGNVGSN